MPAKKIADGKPAGNKTKKAATARKAARQESVEKFPIIGLGASAGGLQALHSFFTQVSSNSGMAFIVVVHQTSKQPSVIAKLLQKEAPIPVKNAKNGQNTEPDHIYVIPPGKDINLNHGKIQLLDIVEKNKDLPINVFFRSLAQDLGSRAVAVVLSGTGTDGTRGIKEIKAHNGLVLVQSIDTAEYDGMPRSAINSGAVDMILPPGQMPQKLTHYFMHHLVALNGNDQAASEQKVWLNKIFAILRAQIGHDFSQYKLNTFLRRINRRMGLNHIESYEKYSDFLRENPAEIEALFRELLIGVTHFFRDPESFKILKTIVLPKLIDMVPEGDTFRAWIPGCSTGEEVYSLAMIIREVLDKNPKHICVQLFGTDIDSFAIDKARAGLYPACISGDVKAERLKRFFIKEGDFYRIHKEIRDCAVFSIQDLIKDPPFSRLHLLCCRNLLIYLDTQAQKKLLPLFHYTLLPKGALVLGSSETIGGYSNLFEVLDKKWKIYKRNEIPQDLRQQIDFPSGPRKTEMASVHGKQFMEDNQKINISTIIQKAILDQFAPTALLVDAKGTILYVQGSICKYLETPSGPPTNNILDMAGQGLRIELFSALRAAKSNNRAVTRKRVSVKANGDLQLINLHVRPQQLHKELAGRFLVVFDDIEIEPAQSALLQDEESWAQDTARLAELERELQSTRESHQTTIEELESSNEELISTNEELQSSNEELQSTNEELESSKEELQSLNEELQTVNAELQSKVEALSDAHDDMCNLLNSTEIATIFVDNNLRVKRFTPEATAIVNLIPTDIGRPLQHVVSNLTYENMLSDLQSVLEKLSPKQAEVQTQSGDWFKMRIIPYRTTDNRIDGAVLTFSAINEQKIAQEVLKASKKDMQQAWQLVCDVFDENTDPLALLDVKGKLVMANKAFAQMMRIDGQLMQNMEVLNISNSLLDKMKSKSKKNNSAANKTCFKIDAHQITKYCEADQYHINGRIIQTVNEMPYRILLHFKNQR